MVVGGLVEGRVSRPDRECSCRDECGLSAREWCREVLVRVLEVVCEELRSCVGSERLSLVFLEGMLAVEAGGDGRGRRGCCWGCRIGLVRGEARRSGCERGTEGGDDGRGCRGSVSWWVYYCC